MGLFIHNLPEDLVLLRHVIKPGTVTKHLVHLFKSLSVRLRNTEPYPNEGQEAESGEEDVCAKTGALNQRRGDETDDEVVDPVWKITCQQMS